MLAENPPPKGDACALKAFREAGIGPGLTPTTQASGAVRRGLEAAARAGPRLVTRAVEHANAYSRVRHNGWQVAPRYIGDYGRNWLGRSVIASSLSAPTRRRRPSTRRRAPTPAGAACAGKHRYRIRFAKGNLPPADAFWSVTMYDSKNYLHPNALRRYAIGDRTRWAAPGARRLADAGDPEHSPEGRARGQLAARAARALPHDHADLRAAPLGAERTLEPAARSAPGRLSAWLDSMFHPLWNSGQSRKENE